MITRPRTIICDIDGIIFKHKGDICNQHLGEPVVLPGAHKKFKEWDIEGCHIILMTGRRKSVREQTEHQLSRAGFFYDELIMGVGGGVRVLINDKKPDGDSTTKEFCLDRNKGLKYMETKVSNFIEKPWGSETIIETNEFYTFKKLSMKTGHKCSLQLHRKKHETLYVLEGIMKLWLDKEGKNHEILTADDTFVIKPGVIHRMESVEDCLYLESSTSGLDDVVRLVDDYGRAESE